VCHSTAAQQCPQAGLPPPSFILFWLAGWMVATQVAFWISAACWDMSARTWVGRSPGVQGRVQSGGGAVLSRGLSIGGIPVSHLGDRSSSPTPRGGV